MLTETPENDGFHWRKYGEKKILNAEFPRFFLSLTALSNYFFLKFVFNYFMDIALTFPNVVYK
jgi:hypothetical protein